MSEITFSMNELKALGLCEPQLKAVSVVFLDRERATAADAVAAGAELSDLVLVASAMARSEKDIMRRLLLWSADCAAHVLHLFEDERPQDDRARLAIVAARKFARGEIAAAAFIAPEADAARNAAAGSAARTAAESAADAAINAASRSAAKTAARKAAFAAAMLVKTAALAALDADDAVDAGEAAEDAALAADDAEAAAEAARKASGEAAEADARTSLAVTAAFAAGDASWEAEKEWQLNRLVARLSADEPEDWPLANEGGR